MWNIIFWNICFISRIIYDNRTYFISIINPFLKLWFCDSWTCRIVRKTKVNDIRCFLWNLRCKVSCFCTWHIDYIAPLLLVSKIISCSSWHCISINIYRIYRVTNCNFIIYGENIPNVTWIRLGTITYKNFICRNITSTALVIIFSNCAS